LREFEAVPGFLKGGGADAGDISGTIHREAMIGEGIPPYTFASLSTDPSRAYTALIRQDASDRDVEDLALLKQTLCLVAGLA
jgi:hypothetical protein